MADSTLHTYPRSRLATLDIATIGLQKHHVAAMLEIDITSAWSKIHHQPSAGDISLTGWLIHVIAKTLFEHRRVTAFPYTKGKIIQFDSIDVSMVIEKEINGQRVPIPLVINSAHQLTSAAITHLIHDARQRVLSKEDIVLHRQSSGWERLYYVLPGFMRRWFWKYLMSHPRLAFQKMGNVAFTTVGMMGNTPGWFIPFSVHPVCFGIGAVVKKPVVRQEEIVVRDILHITVLLDHDVIDGADMARFVNHLSERMVHGADLGQGE